MTWQEERPSHDHSTTLRLTAEQHRLLQAYAAQHRLSESAAARQLLGIGLAGAGWVLAPWRLAPDQPGARREEIDP